MLTSTVSADDVIWMLLYGLDTVAEVGSMCIHIPKRILTLYSNVFKNMLLLPFKCLNKVYKSLLAPSLCSENYLKKTRTLQEFITGEKSPSSFKLTECFMSIRKAGMAAVFNAIRKEEAKCHPDLSVSLMSYKTRISDWKLDRLNKIDTKLKVTRHDKNMMKIVAIVLKAISILKAKREKMDTFFNDNLLNMINDGTLSSEKVFAMQERMQSESKDLKEKTTTCIELLAKSQMMRSQIVDETISANKGECGITIPKAIHDLLMLVTSDNAHLKTKLLTTQERLDSLSKEMHQMQHQFDEKRRALKETEENRETLMEKLKTLENLINEEEMYFTDSTLGTDSCSSSRIYSLGSSQAAAI